MDKFIIIDIETGGFDVESGIKEVAAIVVDQNEIVDKLHIGIVCNESLIKLGYGQGYEDISINTNCIMQFKEFLSKYEYPLVAHCASFDRKFLTYHGWLDEEWPVYDSIRAIRYKNPYLFSYALDYLIKFFELGKEQTHTAFGDVMDLYELLNIIKPDKWIQVGASSKKYKKRTRQNIDLNNLDVEVIGDEFKDKNIVFTGKGPYERKFLSLMAIKQGAIVQKGITKQTDVLVVGEGAGQKLQKANDYGIEIVEIEDFMDRVSDAEISELQDVVSSAYETSGVTVVKKPIQWFTEGSHLEGKVFSLVPMRLRTAAKVGEVIEKLGGEYLNTFRQKETNVLVYEEYGEDFKTVIKAKEKGIKCFTLAEFNRILFKNQFDLL